MFNSLYFPDMLELKVRKMMADFDKKHARWKDAQNAVFLNKVRCHCQLPAVEHRV
jgi:hypothetical protein